MTTDDEDKEDTETVEFTHSNPTNTQGQGSINSSIGVNPSGAGSNKLMLPVLPQDIESIDDDQQIMEYKIMNPETPQNESNGQNKMKDKQENDEESDDEEEKVTYMGVFKKIKLLLLGLFLVFFVTFLPFPAYITSIKSQSSWINNSDIIPMPVLQVLTYNIGDYFGRNYLASWTAFSFSKKTLWIGCAWRIVIVPVFIAMYKNWIYNDVVAFISTFLLAVTNGHFCCLLFMWAPSCVNSKEQPLMGTMMSAALVSGITIGSWTALATTSFIPGLESSSSGD